MSDQFPLVKEIPWPDWEELLRRAAGRAFPLFLDRPPGPDDWGPLGRYSFLMCDPVEFFLVPPESSGKQARNVFDRVADRLRQLRQPSRPDLPPFLGGLAGYLGYELNRAFEDVPSAARDDCGWPLLAVGLYDVVLAGDYHQRRAWIISQGLPCDSLRDRIYRARERLTFFEKVFLSDKAHEDSGGGEGTASHAGRAAETRLSFGPSFPPAIAQEYPGSPDRTAGVTLQGQVPVDWRNIPHVPCLTANFAPEEYVHAVRRVVEYIRAGDVFQVNLSQRLATPAQTDPVNLYLRLRGVNPAPFAGYFEFGSGQLLSASPESFLRVKAGRVETRPIKGTRPRTGNLSLDRKTAEELLNSAKDRAENVMITDLLRNDLSRVCHPRSVEVVELCRLEAYARVFHLVSVIRGELRPPLDAFDLLAACFPGGSVTGAPKIRAMEIIAELEPHVRGPYCGSLGYIGFDGSADFSILIRTILHRDGWWLFSVGGGILARSDPQAEYEETWHKARGLLEAVADREGASPDLGRNT